MKLRRFAFRDHQFTEAFERFTARHHEGSNETLSESVREIVAQVRGRGDEALIALTETLDKYSVADAADLVVTPEDMNAALERISKVEREALRTAAARIREYHQHQLEFSWKFEDSLGNELGQIIRPLQRVGLYIPGGQANYPSTVLMTGIPARVAGVGDLYCAMPTPNGERNDLVLAAMALASVDVAFTVGGAQAIAALAYGTTTVPKVDKILGPGGAWVAEAKRQVFGHVGIDVIAGPSEVLIIGDGSTPVSWAVMDLFAQAEHDPMAQSIVMSPDPDWLEAVVAGMKEQLPKMERRDIIRASLENNGAAVLTKDLQQAVDLANGIAPEHLELHVSDPDNWVPEIENAGAIFCGPLASEALGDYIMGPSHVLPTWGSARFSSPLGVYDFLKRCSLIRVSEQGARALGGAASVLAAAEGLGAHERAAQLRMEDGAS